MLAGSQHKIPYNATHSKCETLQMKNITVSVDAETHRLARIRAAELDTSVSALVREFLRDLATQRGGALFNQQVLETDSERRKRLMDEVLEDIRTTRSGFRAADNVSREELYERHDIR